MKYKPNEIIEQEGDEEIPKAVKDFSDWAESEERNKSSMIEFYGEAQEKLKELFPTSGMSLFLAFVAWHSTSNLANVSKKIGEENDVPELADKDMFLLRAQATLENMFLTGVRFHATMGEKNEKE